jgi:alkanesulfonate monooxygenase SsuD/methylene tetrahydromethanopterin reductase-like flavin-dependent oxidoreductase (luciferase family)
MNTLSNRTSPSTRADDGHDLQFGVFITPVAQPAQQAVELAVAADQAGLDLVTFQDHPYQSAFYDTWTLLSYAAARTKRVHFSPNVLNLPLRLPAVVARSAASLDRLSGGRVELGIGAGAFWDGIAAMGGRRLSAGESISALEEAIQIIRGIWATDQPGGVRVEGAYYAVKGAKRGPAPAHRIGIWVGAYKPRILNLTGRLADGWLPSLSYVPDSPAGLKAMNQHIDEGAAAAGRDPAAIRRLLNISGQFTQNGRSFLVGPPRQWAEDLAGLTLDYGISGFILAADDPTTIALYASEVAPAVRELVAAERKEI